MSFLNKVKKGIEQGANTIGSKSKEVLDSAKVKREIDSLEKQKEELFQVVGELVYEGFVKGSLDETVVKEKCQAISQIKSQVQEKNNELEIIKNRPKTNG